MTAWLIHFDEDSVPLKRTKYAHKNLILGGVDDIINYAGQHNHCRMQANSTSVFSKSTETGCFKLLTISTFCVHATIKIDVVIRF